MTQEGLKLIPSPTRPLRAARLASLSGAALAVAAALAIPLSASAQSTPPTTVPVTANPNNYDCSGHIQPGKREAGNPDAQIQYYISCNGPITGFSIVIPPAPVQITNFDASPLAELSTGPVLTDVISCTGDFPTNGINCAGPYQGDFSTPEIITGQFSISQPACRKPQIDPQFVVDEATVSSGVVTQSISGPFDLGTPQYCGTASSNSKPAKAKKARKAAAKSR